MALNVLFGADLTERSRAALKTAYAFAGKTGGTLRILHVADPELPPDYLRFEAEQAEAMLISWTAPYRNRDVDVSISVMAEEAGPAFEEACRDGMTDLIVMGRPRRDKRPWLFRGSTIEQVVSSVDVPVLCASRGQAPPYLRPLVAAGLSGDDGRLVRASRRFALIDAEEVYAVHGAGGLTAAQMSYAGVSDAEYHSNLEDRHRRLLGQLHSQLSEGGLTAPGQAVILDVPAATAISDAAAAFSADLAIVGFRKRDGLARLVKRPTALTVLQMSPIDVLMVPLSSLD